MFKCEWCGAVFDEPLHEPGGEFMFNPMVHDVCPECGNDDFREVIDETIPTVES